MGLKQTNKQKVAKLPKSAPLNTLREEKEKKVKGQELKDLYV